MSKYTRWMEKRADNMVGGEMECGNKDERLNKGNSKWVNCWN